MPGIPSSIFAILQKARALTLSLVWSTVEIALKKDILSILKAIRPMEIKAETPDFILNTILKIPQAPNL